MKDSANLKAFSRLSQRHPWPDLRSLDQVGPQHFALDGGGRQIMVDMLKRKRVELMVEAGCFLCSSSKQWLDVSPDLHLILVDPWGGNWAPYIRRLASERPKWISDPEPLEEVARAVEAHGNYLVALNNIREYNSRVVPVRKGVPEAYEYLKRQGVKPQAIYVDALKQPDDYFKAVETFPDAILCGDDWTWANEAGEFPVRDYVRQIAAVQGGEVEAVDATWIIHR